MTEDELTGDEAAADQEMVGLVIMKGDAKRWQEQLQTGRTDKRGSELAEK